MEALSLNAVPAKLALIVTGAIAIFLGIFMVGCDAAVYATFSNVKIGAWWIIIPVAIAVGFGASAQNKAMIITASIFSIVAVIFGVIGSIIDGVAGTVINQFALCSNVNTGEAWGRKSSPYTTQMDLCTLEYSNHDCICVDRTSNCYFYDGNTAACSTILTSYAHTVSAGAAFDVFTTFMIFVFSIFTCMSCCCPQNLPPNMQGVSQPMQQPVPTVVHIVGTAPVEVGTKGVMVMPVQPSHDGSGMVAQVGPPQPGAVYGQAPPQPGMVYGQAPPQTGMVYGQPRPQPDMVYGQAPPQAGMVYGQYLPQPSVVYGQPAPQGTGTYATAHAGYN